MLNWPEEMADVAESGPRWSCEGSNLVLDFHGDPKNAELVVFSDGNHHMALAETLAAFCRRYSLPGTVFYATCPPGPLLELLRHGGLQIGNFVLCVRPHVFISPPRVLNGLVAEGYMPGHVPFVRNRGNVLLVRRGNPKGIREVADLARGDVRLFLSNPHTEAASYSGYLATLKALAAAAGMAPEFLSHSGGRIIYGRCIHHREAPEAVAAGKADAAIVYYHLALRYVRIFPEYFEMVPLGGTVDDPRPAAGNVVSVTHAGVVGSGGPWGQRFLRFLSSETVARIYRHHGLLPA